GGTSATIATNSVSLVGLVGSDVGNVSLSGLADAFASANVATGIAVSLTSASLTGNTAGNYTVSLVGAPTTTADITAKTLTIGGSFPAPNKVYDGTTSATIATSSLTLVGVLPADASNVGLTGVADAFASANVATGI